MPQRAQAILNGVEASAASARLAQLVADYAFTFRVDADGPTPLEWICSQVSGLLDHGERAIERLTDWERHIHPHDRSTVSDARLGATDTTIEYRLCTPGGGERWLRETIGVDPDLDRGARRVWVAGSDITAQRAADERLRTLVAPTDVATANREYQAEIAERRRIEQALHESEQYNRLLFESLPIGLALCRMNGEFVDFNTAFARIVGRPPEDIRGMTHAEVTPETYAASERLQLEKLERTGRNGPYEKEFIHADGHRVPVRLSGMILHRGGERFIWSSVEDITEQKHAEEELRESNKKYRSLFDTSRDGIKFTTLEGLIEDANPAYLDMIGYTLEELRRVEYRKLTPLRWWPIESDIIANQVMRRGYSDEYEKEYIRKDGTVFPVQVRLWLVRDESGKPARFFGIFRDITERKRHEQATRHRHAQLAHVSRLTTVGEMAAGIAHELNQPLSALTNYAHGCLRRLQSGKADEDMLKSALENITVQAARASEIVRRVRSFVGKDDQRRADTDINELIHHGLDMVDLDLRRHAVSVEVDLAPDLPKPHVDAAQIEQVIINLLLNGIEAMRQHRLEIPKFHVRTARERGAVSITITDNGPGIDPAVVDQIFDPFFTTKERGMGMGLSICRSIIEQHGGRLWAEQAPTGGAVFTFLLPTAEGGQANAI
jgi:two-component system sensor kinase FixL